MGTQPINPGAQAAGEGVAGVAFMGEYRHTLDAKGRLAIPARFREGLGERFVATRGMDNCLWVYPPAEWDQFSARLQALPATNPSARALQRFFLAGATECEVDAQGRILIPESLREHARLDREAVVVGVGAKVEIWARGEWEAYQQKQADLGIESISAQAGFDL